jgi:F-type H+-transporting ATPase subunit b
VNQSGRSPEDEIMMALPLLIVAQEGQVEAIARTFGVDWPHLIAQTLSFSIVCALLYWLAYKPVLSMLATRREQIATGLANAEKIKAELAKTESQRQVVLAQARADAAQLIEQAHAAAARLEALETQKALANAQQIIATANEVAAQDRVRMLAELKREVGRLVIQTTATVTGKILTPDDHRRLAEETTRGLSG